MWLVNVVGLGVLRVGETARQIGGKNTIFLSNPLLPSYNFISSVPEIALKWRAKA